MTAGCHGSCSSEAGDLVPSLSQTRHSPVCTGLGCLSSSCSLSATMCPQQSQFAVSVQSVGHSYVPPLIKNRQGPMDRTGIHTQRRGRSSQHRGRRCALPWRGLVTVQSEGHRGVCGISGNLRKPRPACSLLLSSLRIILFLDHSLFSFKFPQVPLPPFTSPVSTLGKRRGQLER